MNQNLVDSNCASCTFTTVDTQSPIVATRSPATGTAISTPSSFTITLTGTNLDLSVTKTAYLEDINNVNTRYTATVTGSVSLAFTSVPAGKYLLFAHFADNGYAAFATVND